MPLVVFWKKKKTKGDLVSCQQTYEGWAENNEASPRHLPALVSRKYNTTPQAYYPSPPPMGGTLMSCEAATLEMDLVDKSLDLLLRLF